jgi:hypothetical protein
VGDGEKHNHHDQGYFTLHEQELCTKDEKLPNCLRYVDKAIQNPCYIERIDQNQVGWSFIG